MAAGTSFLITAVRMNLPGTRAEMVEVRESDGGRTGEPQLWTRAQLISACQAGGIFRTATREDGKEWRAMEQIYLVEDDGSEFLRTDESRVIADYLGSVGEL